MKTTMQYIGFVLGVCAFLVWLGFGIGSSRTVPEHALVFARPAQNVYVAPHCISTQEIRDLAKDPLMGERIISLTMTIGEAHKLKLLPDPKCRDEGGFVQEGRSLSGMLLERIGLLSPLESRWNPDGSWNW
jgi:hypothetical protein